MNLWQDFRRRKMLRVVGLYIVGAWLVMQVADVFFPAWGIPDTALRYLITAAIACFPIALIFGWIFDITADGIVRTRRAAEGETHEAKLKPTDYVLLSAMIAIGVAVLVASAGKIHDEMEGNELGGARPRANSVAVLPFVNLDENADTQHFSDGVTEEILHRLSTSGSLHVLARTSSFAFRDNDLGSTNVAQLLGVSYLLQGSVRRDSDHVRITARLIDADGYQVWSQSFERQLKGIFVIQAEIAGTVAKMIVNEIVPLRELPAGRTTTNMEAYNQYLIGNAFHDTRIAGWRDKAISAFERAIELDPGFAPPHAGLAMSLTVNRNIGPHTEQALSLAERALELDPDFADAHAIYGLLRGFYHDFAAGEASIRRALELDPSLPSAYNWLNFVLRQQGFDDEANAVLEQGLVVDPINPPMIYNLAGIASTNGDFDRAEKLLLRLIGLPEPPAAAYDSLSELYRTFGYLAPALDMARRAARHFASRGDRSGLHAMVSVYATMGMEAEVDHWASLMMEENSNPLEKLAGQYELLRTREYSSPLGNELREHLKTVDFDDELGPFLVMWSGHIFMQLREFSVAVEQIESGIYFHQEIMRGEPGPEEIDLELLISEWDPELLWFSMQRMVFAYRELGRHDDAAALLDDLNELFMPDGIPQALEPPAFESAALQHALAGDLDLALEALTVAVDKGWVGYFELINDPAWEGNIAAPEFREILESVRESIDQQRAKILQRGDGDAFRQEIETLLRNASTGR